jgi:xyloglucan-specific exo-beta-1,4-glucanase
MVASLEIDPFDSDHWLYGTGLTVYGGHDLTKFPNVHVQSLADGIEEEAVLSLIAPPGGAPLLSAVGDDGGFRHVSLDISPNNSFQNPFYSTTSDLDYAGTKPLNIVRIGNSNSAGVSQMAVSTDGGVSWNPQTVSSTSIAGGQVAYGADGVNIIWVSGSGTYRFSNGAQSTISLSSSVKIASDKVNGNYFYAADQNNVYVSSDGGATWPTSTSLANYGVNAVEVHPTVAGDVWISTSNGLYHSTNFGQTFTQISGVTGSYAIALGKGTGSYPNVYSFVSTTGSTTLQVSADMGVTWTPISDSGHGFGASGGDCLAASMDTTGLVFVGANGRGAFYGLP